MRVLVCGGREFDNWNLTWTTLDYTCFNPGSAEDVTVIEGGAKGADFLGRVWAKDRGCQLEEYPANWKKYGRGAGHIRNQQMLDEGQPDLVVAFPGGNGTADMIKRARKASVEVMEIKQ